jgi:lipopolysaccharide/colanic/teichoic acid biosynthesis glycosyltransferase
MRKIDHHASLVMPDQHISLFKGTGYHPIKRTLDLALASILLLCSVVMLLIALLIKLQSSGPILYRQQRIGKNGRPFTMLKFRSMRVDNDSRIHRDHVQRLIQHDLHPDQLGQTSVKLAHDPRVTPVGKLIRNLSLDELPQLLNVLRGEMSIVGPRPPVTYEYELYTDWHKRRLDVLPGITGLWQVTARNQVSFEEMVQIDLTYIQSMSLLMDVKIMVQTPLAMLSTKGAG